MFANGDEYFEKGGRMFPRNDSGCTEIGSSRCTMVVHNNYFLTLRAKIYRFKEHGMWAYDKGGAVAVVERLLSLSLVIFFMSIFERVNNLLNKSIH